MPARFLPNCLTFAGVESTPVRIRPFLDMGTRRRVNE